MTVGHDRTKPVHFEGAGHRSQTPCGRDLRMGANIHTTDQIGEITCRRCLSAMKARAMRQERMIAAALGEP